MKKLLVVLGLMLIILVAGAICVVLANPDVVTKVFGEKEPVNVPTNTIVEEDTNTQSPSNEVLPDDESDTKNETNKNEVSNTLVVGLNPEDEGSKEPTEDEIKELLELYAIGINRIKKDENNLESNTVLIYIAKSYFDTHNSVSIDIDTKYATTVKNVHKFLSELTTRKFDENSRIKAYSNIIEYSAKTNSYAVGSDVSFLKNEEYSASDITFEKNNDDTYSGTARIIRKSKNGDDDAEFTHYDAKFDFSINEDYTYSKYKILNIDVENIDHDIDNTRHFS